MPEDNMKKTTEQKIKDKEEELKVLKRKLIEEQNKKDFIYIKELNLEVQTNKHHLDKSYDDLVKEFGEEYLEDNILTFKEVQELRNLEHKGKYKLGLINTWEFCKQEDLIAKEKGYVAGFCADSDGLYLNTYRNSDDSDSYLGVRFCKRRKNERSKS